MSSSAFSWLVMDLNTTVLRGGGYMAADEAVSPSRPILALPDQSEYEIVSELLTPFCHHSGPHARNPLQAVGPEKLI